MFAALVNEIRAIFIRLSQFFISKSLSCIYRDGINAASFSVGLIFIVKPLMLTGPQDVLRIVLGDRQGS